MRQLSALIALMVVLLIGLFGTAGLAPAALAQDASPEAPSDEEEGGLEGIGFEFVSSFPIPEMSGPATIVDVFRITLEPDAFLPLEEDDPTSGLAYIESGSVTIDADISIPVLRAPEDPEGFPGDAEEMPAGTEFSLEEGDSAMFPPNVFGDVRNDGSEPATVLIIVLAPDSGEAET